MTKIKIAFNNFWKGFDLFPLKFFYDMFPQTRQEYIFEIDQQNPDFRIYSCFGNDSNIENDNGIKILYLAENKEWNLDKYDYVISFLNDGKENHFTLPTYIPRLFNQGYSPLFLLNDYRMKIYEKTSFCNFLYSHEVSFRNSFAQKLSQYKKVDCPGKCLNNFKPIGKTHRDKINFIRHYKFTIAFENSSQDGYTTEKLIDPMLYNSIPIYWGNEKIGNEFNPKGFINYYDFSNEKELIDFIIEVDNNDKLYNEILMSSWLKDDILPEVMTDDYVLNIFKTIFN